MKSLLSTAIGLVLLCGAASGQDQKAVFDESYRVRGELEVTLNADGGNVQFYRNDQNECRVYVEYQPENCQLDVVHNERNRTLTIDVDHRNWSMFKNSTSQKDQYALVKIALPHKPDLDLKVQIKAGEIDMQLGDLHVRNLELKSWAGETRLDFDQPNKTDMETFDVDCKMGEVKLLHLGYAKFSEAEINGSVGEMMIDFTGDKIKRGMARLDLDIGSTTVVVPEDIAVKLKVNKFLFLSNVDYPSWFEQQGDYYYSKNYQDKDESLYLIVSTGIGELKMRVARSD